MILNSYERGRKIDSHDIKIIEHYNRSFSIYFSIQNNQIGRSNKENTIIT